jgi:plastocyanin
VKAALLGFLFLAATSAALAAEVRIKDYKFLPEKVTVKAGETVKWVNDEKRASHSIVFPQEKIESERLLGGDSWQRKFERPGTYPYTCEPHPEMKGVVEVLP